MKNIEEIKEITKNLKLLYSKQNLKEEKYFNEKILLKDEIRELIKEREELISNL